jgi:Short C-terminal domain
MKAAAAMIIVSIISFAGCAVSTPIEPASSSKSAFIDAVFKGETVTTGVPTPGNESYRVFIQGATGFVSMQSVRDDAEDRAKEFCSRRSEVMESLSETTATPPYILGNLPRIEIVFQCNSVNASDAAFSPTTDPRYAKLIELKNLLDKGVITQEEFDREKARVLNRP